METNKELFDIYLNKLHKEAISNQEARKHAEGKRKREAIYKEITKDIKFVSEDAFRRSLGRVHCAI